MKTASSSSLALDSNLLLLLTVGSFEPRCLSSFKRLSSFTADDLWLVQNLVLGRKLITTPHVLTEVSNLANSLPEPLREGFLRYFRKLIPRFSESFLPATSICQDGAFAVFGLTDAAICIVCETAIVVTEDRRLHSYMVRRGLRAFTLMDLRAHFGQIPPFPVKRSGERT